MVHRKIEFQIGKSLEYAVNELLEYKKRGELVYGEFNGRKLYSDVDDMDSAFKKVTGKTKVEHDAMVKADQDKYNARKEAHKTAIPELTKQWIEKGNAILDKKYHSEWARCVPIRLNDLYDGMELGHTLSIIEKLNAGCKMDAAKKIIERQGHSGMSFSLVCSMVKSFCDRGDQFVNYVR